VINLSTQSQTGNWIVVITVHLPKKLAFTCPDALKEYMSASVPCRTLRTGAKSKIRKHFSPSICKSYLNIIESMTQQVTHPMVKFQRQVHSLVETKIIKPSDSLWKIALLYGDEWAYWKKELLDFGFTMQDPIGDLLAVEAWDEE
jgi:hypothetical protein